MKATQPDPATWVVQTRLIPPEVHPSTIERSALVKSLLAAIRSHPLTLISAPGGYGKTTLLSVITQGQSELDIAWLTLATEDNDPLRFVYHLLGAFESARPGSTSTIQSLIGHFNNPVAELQRFVGLLINAIGQLRENKLVLILDDLHTIEDPGVLEALDYFLEYSPSNLHIVIATRRDPLLSLARYRGRGQLAEFRADRLRFSDREIIALFNDRLGLDLSPDELDMVTRKTEGWPAGLRILANALLEIRTPDAVLTGLKNLLTGERFIFDFFATEILNRQSSRVKSFLLRTSILSELTVSACQAVTGESDVADILEDLVSRNVFLSAVRTSGAVTYRYHNLFSDFLRHRLEIEYSADQIQRLHLKAARALPAERAIDHLLVAESWEAAGQLILSVGPQVVESGFFGQLRTWISTLPEPILKAQPYLLFFLGLCAFQQGDFNVAQTWVENAVEGFEQAEDLAGEGEGIALLGGIASGLHQVKKGAVLIDEALEYPLSSYSRIRAHINRAWVSVYTNRWDQVNRDVEAAFSLAYQLEEPGGFNVLAPHITTPLILIPDGVRRMREYCERAITWFGEEPGPVLVGAFGVLGNLALVQGDLERAEQALEKGREMSKLLGGFVWLDINIDFGHLNLFIAHRHYRAFEEYWLQRRRHYESTIGAREYLNCFLYLKGRVLWSQNRFEEMQDFYRQMETVAHPEEIPEGQINRLMMRALMEMVERRYAAAEGTLQEAITQQKGARQSLLFGNAQHLLALCYLQWKRPDAAMAAFGSAMRENEGYGMPALPVIEGEKMIPLLRLAVDRRVHSGHASGMLEILDPQKKMAPIEIPETGERLTPREVEVLHLITAGLSNREIAERLVLSETTIKSHVTGVLRKMDVKSRTQAAALARALGLI